MCYRRSRRWEERADEGREKRLWDLFYRETERSEPPVPIADRDREHETERDEDEVTVGTER